MEVMVMAECDGGPSSPAPHHRVAEMQEMGPNDAPVDDWQQRGGASARGAREGAEGKSAVFSRPRNTTIDASGSNQELERVSDAESVGWVESVTSDRRRTVLTQPPETTLTTSLVRKGDLAPVADCQISCIVTELRYLYGLGSPSSTGALAVRV